MAPKGFLYYPEMVPPAVNLPAAIRKSFKKTLFMMLSSPPRFAIRGILYIAPLNSIWGGARPEVHQGFFGTHGADQREQGGGGFRFMYAAFLHEASVCCF